MGAAAEAAEKAAKHLEKAAKFAAKAARLGGLDCDDLVASGDPVADFPAAVTDALAAAGKGLGSALGR